MTPWNDADDEQDVDVEENLSAEEAPAVLASIALAKGVGLETMRVIAAGIREEKQDRERLAKARTPPTKPETWTETPREPIVTAILRQWRIRHAKLKETIGRNLQGIVTVQQRFSGNRSLLKEAPFLLQFTRSMIATSYAQLHTPQTGWSVPRLVSKAWKEAGVELPAVTISTLQNAAFLAGAAAGQTGQDGPAADLEYLERAGHRALLSSEMLAARDWATLHAGHFVSSVGGTVSGMIAQRELEIIHDLTARHFDERSTAENWTHVARRMRDAVADLPGVDRDFDRVAVSETRWAYNSGRLLAMADEGVTAVRYEVQPTACDECKRIYLEPDGTPRVFVLTDILADLNGPTMGMNVGRQRKDWQPGALLHPWDSCRPVRADGPRVPWRP